MKKPALLLINLGTPDSPEPKAVGRYLKEFLMDRYVIDLPYFLRWIIVRLFIVPRRSKSSSELYKNIWSDKGSPLLVNSINLLERLRGELSDRKVSLAMRYGSPSIKKALRELKDQGEQDVEILPLYPQYATSSVETVLDKCREDVKALGFSGGVSYYKEFYHKEVYIRSVAKTINKVIEEKKPDFLLYSYHGLPEHQVAATGTKCAFKASCCDTYKEHSPSCYRAQCYQTSKLINEQLVDKAISTEVAFQSRLAGRPWLKPYTDVVVKELAGKGVKRLAVACPAFTADCLETLEEIEIRIKEDFVEAGGEDVFLVPSLNDNPDWAQAIKTLLEDQDLKKPL